MQTIYRRHCTLSHFSLNIYLFCQPSISHRARPKSFTTIPLHRNRAHHATLLLQLPQNPLHRRLMKQKSHKHHRNHFQSTKTSSSTTPGNLPLTPHPLSSKSSPTEKRLRLSWHNLFFLCFGFSPKLFFCSSSQYRR